MRRDLRRALVPVLALTVAWTPRPAPAQTTIPGTRVDIVQLDVVVTDKEGRPVLDLTRDEFVVLDEGRPQQLTHFLVAGGRSAASPDPAPTIPSGAAAPPAPETRRAARRIVLVVDDLHIGGAHLNYAREALRRAVAELAGEGDEVAVVTTARPGFLQPLTRDLAAVKTAINGLQARDRPVAETVAGRMTAAQAELILRGDRGALQLAARTLVGEPGSLYDNSGPRAAMESPIGRTAGLEDPIERVAAVDAERQARALLAEALRFSTVTLGVIDAVVRGLAPLPGRKVCVVVSDGFLVGAGTREERARELQAVIDAATRSGTAVYTLDSHGLVSSGGDASVRTNIVSTGLEPRVARQSEQLFRETLHRLADQTGGFLVSNTNDLAGGLRRMLQDNQTYYLLAYEPTNTRRDGRFRKIEVRVPGRPGLTVRTRRGYFAPDDRARPAPVPAILAGGPAAPAPDPDQAAAHGALGAPVVAGGLPVRLRADYLELPPAGPQAVVRAHVDIRGLGWQLQDGRHRAAVDLVGNVFDASGQPVGPPFGRRTELDMAEADRERASGGGLQFQEVVSLPPGRYQVRLVVREVGQGRLGGAEQAIEIPDLKTGALAVSGLFLSSSAPSARTGRDAGALHRFKRSDSVFFQVYVYNAAPGPASDVVLQAQIWQGGKVIAASKPQPAALLRKDGAPVPETNEMGLATLEPGDYELRVVVVDRKASTQVVRRADLTVE